MEVGKILLRDVIDTAYGNIYETIVFKNVYKNPVVIAYIMTRVGGESIDVRVRNVTQLTCEIFMQEWDNEEHSSEWVSYMVIESGKYLLPSGLSVEADTTSIPATAVHNATEGPGSFNTVNINFQTIFSTDPAFFVTLNTFNNNDFMSVSSMSITSSGAEVFQEKQRTNKTPADEIAGWVAISEFSGELPWETVFETGKFSDGSSDGVGDTPHKVTYTQTYSEPPIVFSQVNTLNGWDGSWARGYFWALDYFETYAEEADDGGGMSHNDEVFSHLVFDSEFSIIYDETFGIFTSEKYRNICTVDPYVFKASVTGVKIYDLASESLVSCATFSGGVNSVWANDDYLYAATSFSGVCRATISTVTGTITFSEYKSYPNITANDVNYIHGSGDYLCISTVSGVDRIKISNGTREYQTSSRSSKCFQTSKGDYYYVVNQFKDIQGLDDNLFWWSYGREVNLSSTIPEDNYQLKLTIPITQPDNIYTQAMQEGIDVRVIDSNGQCVPHFIEVWDYVSPVDIWVKLSRGVDTLYIIYGNRSVVDTSSAEGTFRLYDHFEGTTLNEERWDFDDGGSSTNTYIVANSVLSIRTTSNDYTVKLYSNEAFFGGVIEAKVKYRTTDLEDDMDYTLTFLDSVLSYIGVDDSWHEFPHYIRTYDPQGVSTTTYGTKLLSTEWKIHTVVETPDYQASNYDGETVATSATLDSGYRKIRFSYNSGANKPDLDIDWVRVRNYDQNPPVVVVERGKSINDLFDAAELHAVYDNGDSYTYSSSQNDVISSAYISDLYVTENTSIYGDGNVIFLGTSWGAYVLEEKRGDESNCRKRIYLIET